jgi:hypothetical protein
MWAAQVKSTRAGAKISAQNEKKIKDNSVQFD